MKKILQTLLILFMLFPIAAPMPVAAQGQSTCEIATLHYKRSDADYEGWGLHIWGSTAVNDVTWTSPFMPTGEDEYGLLWEVPMAEGATLLNYIVHNGDEKDPGPDQVMTFSDVGCGIWLVQGSAEQYLDAESALADIAAPLPVAAQGQDSCEIATLHYKRSGMDYEGWGLHIWGPTAVNDVTWTSPFMPTGEDEYGLLWDVPMAEGATLLNYIVHNGDEKDPGPDQVMTFSEVGCEIWLKQGSAVQELTGESVPTDGDDKAIIHYRRVDGEYAGWELHIWDNEGVTWETPSQPAGQDDYGVYWIIDMPAGAESLNYLISNNDVRENGPTSQVFLNARGREIWLIEGSAQYTSLGAAMSAFEDSYNIQGSAKAHWLSRNFLVWDAELSADDQYFLNYSPDGDLQLTGEGIQGGESWPLLYVGTVMRPELVSRFPHLEGMSILKLMDEYMDQIPEVLRGQVVVSAMSPAGSLKGATSLQTSGVLDALYAESASGVVLGTEFIGDVPTVRVWAPTAKSVAIRLFDDSTTADYESLPMDYDPATGVWSITGQSDWKNKFYLYDVEVFVRQEGALVHNLVTDPYSFSLSLNSTRSQIVDLNDPALMPAGWVDESKPALDAFTDIVLYELHIRDFSVMDETVPADERGTFVAFTETESNGMKHLTELANAGVTHVHLLPAFDIATINEDRSQQNTVDFAELATMAPDSPDQQAAVNEIRATDGFNWGYDPYHYTVPEGSYSTDPDGAQRILEFREMVQSLNANGLRVVMDVVYNHTNASGQSDKSVLDKIVPGYYYRLNNNGAVETSTCCQNTATENAMMRKLMIDSVLTWTTAYKVDGFRFDLMGHHMVDDMVALREALNELTPATDGVDGEKVYVYGEGWNFGEVADNARGVNATQLNMTGNGIGTFNDRIRDAARGGSPFTDQREQGFATGLYTDPSEYTTIPVGAQLGTLLEQKDWIRITLAGNLVDYELVNAIGETVTGAEISYNGSPAAYAANPEENIVYVSAHDNETLFDAIQYKLPAAATLEERVQAQSFALSLVAFSQGVPFFHAGSEILRSKSMDRDSYDSGDWFNALDWTLQDNGWGRGLPVEDKNGGAWDVIGSYLGNPEIAPGPAEMASSLELFEQWTSIRQSSPLFRLRTAEQIKAQVEFLNTGPSQIPGVIAMSIKDDLNNRVDMNYDQVVVLWNASPEEVSFTADGLGELKLHPLLKDAHNAQATYADGTFNLPPRSTAVFVHTNVSAQPTDAHFPSKEADAPSSRSGYWLVGLVVLLVAAGAFFGLRKKK